MILDCEVKILSFEINKARVYLFVLNYEIEATCFLRRDTELLRQGSISTKRLFRQGY